MKIQDYYNADVEVFLDNAQEHLHRKLVEELRELDNGVKFQLALKVGIKKFNTDENDEFTDPILHNKSEVIMNADDMKES